MILPWDLIGTAAAAVVVGWLVSRVLSGRLGTDPDPVVDAAFAIGVTSAIAGRVTRVVLDLATAGPSALDLRAVASLGAGVSTGGAVLGGLAAGLWVTRRRWLDTDGWRVLAVAGAAALSAWSLAAVIRGEVGGIRAPVPLGWPIDGAPRVPVALVEAVVFAALSRWAWTTRSVHGPRLGSAVAAVAAATGLLGAALRPSLPTVDADVEAVLGLVALGLSVAAATGNRRGARLASGAAGLVLVGVVALVLAAPPGPTVEPAPRDGAPAAVGDLELVDGRVHADAAWTMADLDRFVAAADGRPVVVNFWASWCAPCRAEAPTLARSARALGDEVAFLGVNVDDDPGPAQAFADRYLLPFPSVGGDGIRRGLGMGGLPTTVVLRADGSIATRLAGGLDAASLAGAIDRARTP